MQYGATHADLAATPPERAWQMLRSLRHQPPGRATNGDRRGTFNAALEQSEQFMTAAAVAGVATRPVLAFYALTQAAWAINAASTDRTGQDWRLPGGHGITARNLSTMTGSLASLTVQDSGKGSFTTVAGTLRSASVPDETALGDLWCLLPDVENFPLPNHGNARPISIGRENNSIVRGGRTLAILGNLPARLRRPLTEGNVLPDWVAERADVRAYLDRFPTLEDALFVSYPGQPVGLQWQGADAVSLKVLLGESDTITDEIADVAKRSHVWCGMALAYPTIGGSERSAHPFLLWWAILFALSQLARYQPKAWLALTDIVTSSDASPIEHLLDRALVTLPELIHRTIMEASEGPPAAG